jgi:hypothetical protein
MTVVSAHRGSVSVLEATYLGFEVSASPIADSRIAGTVP